MTEEKFKKVVVASTVGAVLLIVILVSVMVYQLVAIKIQKNKRAELDSAIAHYQVLIKDGKDSKEARSTRWWIEQRARELGYVYSDDV